MKYVPIFVLAILLLAPCFRGPVRAQDNYAQNLYLVASPFALARVEGDAAGLSLEFTCWMPDEGWELTLDKGGTPDDSGLTELFMTLTPPEERNGVQKEVVVRTAAVKLKPGRKPVNIWWRSPGSEYELRALYTLQANVYDKTKAHEFADSGYLFAQSQLGAGRHTGVRVISDRGNNPKFTLKVTEGVPYDKGYKLEFDKVDKPREGVINAWVTAIDTSSGKSVRPTVAGWKTAEVELAKIAPGNYLLNVHRRNGKKSEYAISQRALLRTDAPLSPTPDRNPEELPQRKWQPATPQAPEATSARLQPNGLASVTLRRPSKPGGNWTLALSADLAAGEELESRGLRVDAEARCIEIELWAGTPSDAGQASNTVVLTLPHLAPVRYQCEAWLSRKDEPQRLAWCRMLTASSRDGLSGPGVIGAMPTPYSTLTLEGWLDGDKEPAMALKPAGKDFKLETRFKCSIYEKNVKVDRVEGPDDDGVIRVYLEFTPEKNYDDNKPHVEKLSVRLGGLHAGRYRVEFLRDTWFEQSVMLPERTCWIEAEG